MLGVQDASTIIELNKLKSGKDKISHITRNLKANDPALDRKLEKVSKDMETMFINKFLENMFKEIKMNPLDDQNRMAYDIYKSLMLEQYAKATVNKQSFGLSDSIKRTLLNMQEIQNMQANKKIANDGEKNE